MVSLFISFSSQLTNTLFICTKFCTTVPCQPQRIAMSTSWHINHDPLNDCLPLLPFTTTENFTTWCYDLYSVHYTYVHVHMNLYMYVCVSAFWWQDIRLYANISVCLFVYCLLFPICVCSIWKLEKFFIHTDICKYVFFLYIYILRIRRVGL